MITIPANGQKNLSVMNRTIKGLTFFATLVHGTVNTAFLASDFTWQNVLAKVKLKRNGKEMQICNANLRDLSASSNYFQALFLQALSTIVGSYVWVAQAGGVYAQAICPAKIDFGGVVNLRGNDELTATIQCLPGAFAATLNTSTSVLNADFEEGIGYEIATPQIDVFTLLESQTDHNLSLGSNVKSIYVLNYDKTSYVTGENIINSVDMTSRFYSPSWLYGDLLTNQATQFDTIAEAKLRLQSFCLYRSEIALHGVELTLHANGSDVTASNNVVVSYKQNPSRELLNKSIKARQKHDIQEAQLFA